MRRPARSTRLFAALGAAGARRADGPRADAVLRRLAHRGRLDDVAAAHDAAGEVRRRGARPRRRRGGPPARHYYQRDVRYGASGIVAGSRRRHIGDPEPFGIAGLRVYGDAEGRAAVGRDLRRLPVGQERSRSSRSSTRPRRITACCAIASTTAVAAARRRGRRRSSRRIRRARSFAVPDGAAQADARARRRRHARSVRRRDGASAGPA